MNKWLNSSLLPKSAQAKVKEGLYAEFHADAQLLHFGYYRDGSCEHGWALYLDHGVERGRARVEKGSGGTADYEIYDNGKAELFDAWSDNSPARPIPFRKWVERWVEHIAKYAERYKKPQT